MKEEKDIIILAIESSCDDTSIAILKGAREVLSNIISSQIDIHTLYGGVVPEIASRQHIQNIDLVLDEALKVAGIELNDIDIICTTYGPGLVGSLLVGVSYAKALAYALNIPLIPVNHIAGHIAANYISHKELEPPFIALVVSGGHSHLLYVKDYTEFEILGRTRDDAVGEAFDKVARVLGLGYPGGPKVEELAKLGEPSYKLPVTKFENLDFSFSGIKTAVLNIANKENDKLRTADMCNSFQTTITKELIENSIRALNEYNVEKLVLAGGVSANTYLREALREACTKSGFTLYVPDIKLCMDNAAMIGCAGYYNYAIGIRADKTLNAVPNLKIDERKF